MFDEVRYLTRKEQYEDLLKEAERERLLRRAALDNAQRAHKREKAIEQQPAPEGESGLVLQLHRLISFLL